MNFRFAQPEALFLLILILPLFFLLCRKADKRSGFLFSNVALLKQSGLVAARWKLWLSPTLRFLALTLIVLALARPQYGKVERIRDASGVDILLVLDVSESMRAMDFIVDDERVDRLQMLKTVAKDFIEKRPSDRMGLIVFGREAYTQCPLTLDHAILGEYMDELQIGMAGNQTAIGQGLALAVKRLSSVEAKSRIVVLITDGENNAGQVEPDTAAELAREMNVKVYTIAIGRDGPVPFPTTGFFGQRRLVEQRIPVDFALLQQIAATTGGRSYRAEDTEEMMDIYQEINALEKTEFKIREFANYEERMSWFAFPALLGILLDALIGLLRPFRRIE